MVCRPLARRRLGRLFRHLHPHPDAPQRAAHLRVQLVLHGLHPGGGAAAHRQQPGGAGLLRFGQELLAVLGRAGCDDAVVVWAQRRGVLPHRRVLGHDVLLPAQARRPADLFLSALHHQFLGHHLHVYVGGLAPSAFHRAAALGADAGHGLLGGAAGAVLGLGRQCAADAQRRLAQGARRRRAALHGDGRVLLRPFHLRGLVHGHPRRQLALPLHRLDHRARPCRRPRLGGDDHLRLDLRARAVDVEEARDVFQAPRRDAFLVGAFGHRHLRLCHVELRHHARADVADLRPERRSGVQLRR